MGLLGTDLYLICISDPSVSSGCLQRAARLGGGRGWWVTRAAYPLSLAGGCLLDWPVLLTPASWDWPALRACPALVAAGSRGVG